VFAACSLSVRCLFATVRSRPDARLTGLRLVREAAVNAGGRYREANRAYSRGGQARMESELLQNLLSIGLLQPRASVNEMIDALAAVGAVRSAVIITRHKVRQIGRARAKAYAEKRSALAEILHDFDAAVAENGRARERRGIDLDGQLAAVRKLAGGLDVRLMKGLGVRGWYPPDLPRDVGDADLWVPDLDAGWQLAGVLRETGYDYEPGEMPWLKRDPSGALFGQIRMVHPDPERVDIDIHAGPYSVRYCGLLTFAASAAVAGSPPDEWAPLAPEDNLCSVIGNAAGDCFIDAKVINDVVAATGCGVDFRYVADRVAEAELSGFLNALVEQVHAACALTEQQARAVDRLRTDDPAEPVALALEPDPALRTRLVTDHARRMGRRLPGADADAIVRQAQAAYGNPRTFRARTSGGAAMRMPVPTPWTCVRLAPQPLVRRLCGQPEPVPTPVSRRTPLARGLDLVESPAGDLLRFRDDVFLPTQDYLFCLRLVRAQLPSAKPAAG
jgi:hypothetical protein